MRPRQASLRRAASAAYYALFRLLVGSAVTAIVARDLRAPLSRVFDHGPMKHVCSTFSATRGGRRPAVSPALTSLVVVPLEPEIVRLARAFVDLQEFRHVADYDLSQRLNRPDVLSKIEQARNAFSDGAPS